MESFDALILARMQFAANITFHILFPTISIALGWFLIFFKTRFLSTGQAHWMAAYQFWIKIFALTFAIGAVSGITMSFQFGTNWPGFMNTVGNVAGPLLAYEVLTAFFLEATMLGIMLFGRGRVSEWVHTLATWLVAFGTTASAFWILALDSWMQTPSGFEMIDGKAYVLSWFDVIFNPSFPFRMIHMLLASGLTVAFLVAGLSAFRWLKGDRSQEIQATLRVGVWVAAVLIPVQILVGDLHGLNTLEHQPAKIAAMEAIWETEEAVPFTLFALPDETTRSNRYAVEIPYAGSLVLTHDAHGKLQGLNDFIGEHPPVAMVFWSFRVMLAMGGLMLLTAWLSAWQFRGRHQPGKATLHLLSAMAFSGWVAVLAGWYVTEIGRQPWIVTGVLTVKDVAADHSSATVGGTLFGYVLLYAFLLGSYIAALRNMSNKPAASLAMIGVPKRNAATDHTSPQNKEH